MLKVAARAKYAHKHAEAVLAKKKAKELKQELKQNIKSNSHYGHLLKQRKVFSRAQEMEDKLLGPLTPRRYATDEERRTQGALSQEELMPAAVLGKDRIKYWNIVPGDRVLILKGVDKHKIGTVKMLNKESNTLVVEGLNMITTKTPEYFLEASPKTPPVSRREIPIHYDDVRLVYPLPDAKTGELKDTIIAELVTAGIFYDRKRSHGGWKRMVANTDIVIPWPKGEAKKYVDEACDTLMIDVEFVTYKPTLLKCPFPASVIDELRNKYSEFRTRHDPEWVAKKDAEYKDLEAKKQTVRTPIQELNRKIRLEKKALGPPVLTAEVLETIGRVMAQTNPAALEKLRAETSTAGQNAATITSTLSSKFWNILST